MLISNIRRNSEAAAVAAGACDVSIKRGLFLLQFELAGGFIFFEEFAELGCGFEQANPLFVIKRDGKAAEAIDADATFFADAKFEGLARAAAGLFFHLRNFCLKFFVGWFGHGVSCSGWS